MVAAPSTSTHRHEIRDAIIGPLTAMTNFGNLPEQDRKAAGLFWIEALKPYRIEEIKTAFVEFTRREGFLKPQAIVAIILEERRTIGARISQLERDAKLKAEWEADQAKDPIDIAERKRQADAILAGFKGSSHG